MGLQLKSWKYYSYTIQDEGNQYEHSFIIGYWDILPSLYTILNEYSIYIFQITKITMWTISTIECCQLIEVKNKKTTQSTVQAKQNKSVAKFGQKAANLQTMPRVLWLSSHVKQQFTSYHPYRKLFSHSFTGNFIKLQILTHTSAPKYNYYIKNVSNDARAQQHLPPVDRACPAWSSPQCSPFPAVSHPSHRTP